MALLRYVGPEARLQVTRADDSLLTRAILECGMRVRLSVCFNDMLQDVPRLWSVGDCGAGDEFVTATSDQRLKACSFHEAGPRVTTADELLTHWQALRDMRRAAPPLGCARPLSLRDGGDGLRVWQGFSANNSGDCVLVGRFEKVEDAERLIEELRPGFRAGDEYSEAWNALFARERVPVSDESFSPQVMARAGRSLLFHTGMTLEDDFAELRALVWRRGGLVVYNGIHEHDWIHLVASLGFRSERDLENAELDLCVDGVSDLERKGSDLFGTLAVGNQDPSNLEDLLQTVESVARKHGRVLAAELIATPKKRLPLAKSLAQPGSDSPMRLWISFREAGICAQARRDELRAGRPSMCSKLLARSIDAGLPPVRP